jgi:hypothetical protein
MKSVRRYKDLETDLPGLYDAIKKELQTEKELNIVGELEGKIDDEAPFKSITAVRTSIPRALIGGLREVTVSIVGKPDDYLVEVHTGAWLSNIAIPGAEGFLIAGPIGTAVGAGATTLSAVNYQRKLSNKIRELVKEHSKKKLDIDKEESFV